MSAIHRLLSLRSLLLVDAAICIVMGLVLNLGAAPLAAMTGLPRALLLYAGLSLFPIAAVMMPVALWPALRPTGAWLVITGNAAWTAASFALLVSGWVAPNGFGTAFIVAQALTVAVLAKLEHGVLRADGLQPSAA